MPPIAKQQPRTTCPCKLLPNSLSSFTAAEYGDIHSLSKIKDVATRKDNAGYNPLHFTAQFNHIAATAFLLQLGCPVDGGGQCGANPLHRAAFSGATAAMKVLLEWNAPGNSEFQTTNSSSSSSSSSVLNGEVSFSDTTTTSIPISAISSNEKYCDLFARDTR
jgi:ankyrin repeat protein